MKKDIHCGYRRKDGTAAALNDLTLDIGKISNGQDTLVAFWFKCDVADKEHTIGLTPLTARTMAADLLVLANEIEKGESNVGRTNEAADTNEGRYGEDWNEL